MPAAPAYSSFVCRFCVETTHPDHRPHENAISVEGTLDCAASALCGHKTPPQERAQPVRFTRGDASQQSIGKEARCALQWNPVGDAGMSVLAGAIASRSLGVLCGRWTSLSTTRRACPPGAGWGGPFTWICHVRAPEFTILASLQLCCLALGLGVAGVAYITESAGRTQNRTRSRLGSEEEGTSVRGGGKQERRDGERQEKDAEEGGEISVDIPHRLGNARSRIDSRSSSVSMDS